MKSGIITGNTTVFSSKSSFIQSVYKLSDYPMISPNVKSTHYLPIGEGNVLNGGSEESSVL